MRVHVVIFCVMTLGFACKDEPGSFDLDKDKPAEKRSNVKVIKTPVRWGTKIPCEKLFDVEKVGTAIGQEVTMHDVTKTDKEATSVCQFKLAGEPPSAKEQEKKWLAEGRVLGVLPGDEICQVTLYCSFSYDIDDEKEKCQAAGQTAGEEVGELTCVNPIQAGADYRYVYTVWDPDTKCKFLINPGPSVTTEETVKKCAQLAVAQVGPANIK